MREYGIDRKLFESQMKLHGDTIDSLQAVLDISASSISKKKNGRSQWVQKEIAALKYHWSLTADEVDKIFFNQNVS